MPGKQIQLPDNKKAATPRTTPRVVPARQATPPASSARAGASSRLGAINRALPLPKQVEKARAQEQELEAKLEAMLAEAAEAEAASIEAEKAAKAGEEQLISQTAEMLGEFATKCASNAVMEAELADVTAKLEAERVKNLELSSRNLELDREGRVRQQALTDGKAELKRISQSQDELDAALERQNQKCESLKVAAQVQRDQCAADWTRLDAMSKRLVEVSGANPSEEVNRLLVEAAERMKKVEEARIFCKNLHEQGPQPKLATCKATVEEGPQPKLATCTATVEDHPPQAAACEAAECSQLQPGICEAAEGLHLQSEPAE